jgi:hypothetical protein
LPHRTVRRRRRRGLIHPLGFFFVHDQAPAIRADVIAEHRAAAHPFPFPPRRRHLVARALTDQFSFKLRETQQNVQSQPAERCAGIELLGNGNEADVVLFENAQHFREVEQRPAQTIHLIYDHAIERSRLDSTKQPCQCGPIHVGPGEAAIVIDFRQGNPAFAPLAQDKSLGDFALCIERVKLLREIFALFERHGSALKTLAEIEHRGWRLKSWTRKTGQFRPGGPFALNSLRRLLTNIVYTGKVRHKGQEYPGEHTAILVAGIWERVQNLIAHPDSFSRGKSRNKHHALLSGLLYCESCTTRMVYTYAAKNGRKYPYYLCLNAQRRGWAECPARSLPARGIEESVLRRIRDVRHGLIPAEWEQMERTSQVEAVRAVVERVGYDAHKQQILIRFRPDRTLTVAEGEAFDEL